MDFQMISNTNMPNAVARTIELIRGCDAMIASFYEMGETDDSLMIRQEKHLRKQFINDLNNMLKDIHLEVFDTLQKAA
jgi:hypothetical protein